MYRPGVHEACLAQLVRVVRGGLRALNAAHGAPLARLAAALALNPNVHTLLPVTSVHSTPNRHYDVAQSRLLVSP